MEGHPGAQGLRRGDEDLLREQEEFLNAQSRPAATAVRVRPRGRAEPPGGGGAAYVKGLSEFEVGSLEEVMEIVACGAKLRSTKAARAGAGGSRSHTVLTVTVQLHRGQGAPVVGRLSVADLAGSERIKKSHSEGQRFKEAVHINTSLSALAKVVQALSSPEAREPNVPYRDSKLTRLLRDVLVRTSRVTVLAGVDLSRANAEESVNTLGFAQRCKSPRAAPAAEAPPPGASDAQTERYIGELEEIILKLQEESETLKGELEDAMEEVDMTHTHYQKVLESMGGPAAPAARGNSEARDKLFRVVHQAKEQAKDRRRREARRRERPGRGDAETAELEATVRGLEEALARAEEGLAKAQERGRSDAAGRLQAEKEAAKARQRAEEQEVEQGLVTTRLTARVAALEEEQAQVKSYSVEAIRRATSSHAHEILRLRQENAKLAARLAQLAAAVPQAERLKDTLEGRERARLAQVEQSLAGRSEQAVGRVTEQSNKALADLEARTAAYLKQREKEHEAALGRSREERGALAAEVARARRAVDALVGYAGALAGVVHDCLAPLPPLTKEAQGLLAGNAKLEGRDFADTEAKALALGQAAAALRPHAARALGRGAPGPGGGSRPGSGVPRPGTGRPGGRAEPSPLKRGSGGPGAARADPPPRADNDQIESVMSDLSSLQTVQYIRTLESEVKRYRERLILERQAQMDMQVALEAARRREGARGADPPGGTLGSTLGGTLGGTRGGPAAASSRGPLTPGLATMRPAPARPVSAYAPQR